ncbi:MAG: proteasome accessory factor PafA2 family protein [Fimbriimonadaceae bacterium]
MRPILAGIETEYGIDIQGVGPTGLVAAVADFVRSCPIGRRGWDYRFENPRADLRGFVADELAVDPEDMRFEAESEIPPDGDVRSDRVLPNGARLYNDHGHPEYATPECRSIRSLALSDLAGALLLHRMAEASGRAMRLYRNNTDYHGASYGTHESYLLPREVGWERARDWLAPVLAVRGFLCGAGKVGTEGGPGPAFQLTQRADFFSEQIGVDTLYRRPLFNTRDEPHADPGAWMRVHVISGDANPTFGAVCRKVALAKAALMLAWMGEPVPFRLADPVRAFRDASRDPSGDCRIELANGSWTTPRSILDTLLGTALARLDPEWDPELMGWMRDCGALLDAYESDTGRFAREVEWAAKKLVFEQLSEETGVPMGSPEHQAYDLAFHDCDPASNLFRALEIDGAFAEQPAAEELEPALARPLDPTRAVARGLAVERFPESVASACWRTVVVRTADGPVVADLPPDLDAPPQLADCRDVECFVRILQEAGVPCQKTA